MKTPENISPLALAGTFDRSMLEMALSTPIMRESFDIGKPFVEDPYLNAMFRESAERCLKLPARQLDSDTVKGILGHVINGSMVLLKNSKRLLPFTSQLLRSLAVIGPMADGVVAEGMKNAAPHHIQLAFAKGCPSDDTFSDELLAGALSTAVKADAVILCLGTPDCGCPQLPAPQLALLEALNMLGKPMAAVVFGARPHILEIVDKKADAVLLAWQLTAYHGLALGHTLFGQVNPSGRLPVTMPRPEDEQDYEAENSSYLYMRQEPLYPFGYGLSYTRFVYSDLRLSKASAGQTVTAECAVENSGTLAGHEVVQLYMRQESRETRGFPRWSLCGTERIFLQPNETRAVEFKLPPLAGPARYVVYVGGHQPDARSVWLSETPVLSAFVETE